MAATVIAMKCPKAGLPPSVSLFQWQTVNWLSAKSLSGVQNNQDDLLLPLVRRKGWGTKRLSMVFTPGPIPRRMYVFTNVHRLRILWRADGHDNNYAQPNILLEEKKKVEVHYTGETFSEVTEFYTFKWTALPSMEYERECKLKNSEITKLFFSLSFSLFAPFRVSSEPRGIKSRTPGRN